MTVGAQFFHCVLTNRILQTYTYKLILSGYLNLKGVLRSKISLKKVWHSEYFCITDLLQKLQKSAIMAFGTLMSSTAYQEDPVVETSFAAKYIPRWKPVGSSLKWI